MQNNCACDILTDAKSSGPLHILWLSCSCSIQTQAQHVGREQTNVCARPILQIRCNAELERIIAVWPTRWTLAPNYSKVQPNEIDNSQKQRYKRRHVQIIKGGIETRCKASWTQTNYDWFEQATKTCCTLQRSKKLKKEP